MRSWTVRLATIIAVIIVILGWYPAHAAITLNSTSQSADNENASSVTWSHTVAAGSDRYMDVCLQVRGSTKANLALTGVTYGGTALTFVRADNRDNAPNFFRTELWRLIAPTVGTANIVATATGVATEYLVGSSITLNGVNQTTPEHTSGGSSGNGTTLSATITTTTATVWIVDCAIARDDAGLTLGAGQVEHSRRLVGVGAATIDGVGMSSVQGKTPAGAELMDWMQSVSSDWVMSAVAILPATVTVADAITIVQSCAMVESNNSTTASCTLPSLPSAGNTILLLMSYAQLSTGVSSCLNGGQVIDSLGSYFDVAVESPLSGRIRSYIWFKSIFSAPGGSYSVTVTCPSASWITMKAVEVSGLIASYSAYDKGGWAGAIGTVSSTVTAFGTTVQPNELAVAVLTTDRVSALTITKDATWTEQYEQEDCATSGSGSVCGSAVTKILSATVTPSHAWTFSTGVDSAAALATFKAVQSGTGTITRSLTWMDNSLNETAFRVQKRTDQSTPTWVDVATGLAANTTSYAAQISTLETGDCW